MASSPGLPDLPNELIHAIVGHLESRDLLALCRTRRQIHAICLEWIYRSVTLDDLAQVVKCCKTLISRPEAADSVHEFQVLCAPRLPLKSFYTTVGSAVSKLRNVRILNISAFRVLPDTHFPQLSKCFLPASIGIIVFLKRNPHISILMILPCMNTAGIRASYDDLALSIPPIHMPKLQRYEGPASLAVAVVPGSLTSNLTIFWDPASTPSFSNGLAAIARSKVDIARLNNVIHTWDCGLLSAIADHLPRLQHLVVYLGMMSGAEGRERFLSSVDFILPSLPVLRALVISQWTPPAVYDLDTECLTLCRWGEISSALRFGILASNTSWERLEELWLPSLENRRPGMDAFDLKWLFKAVVTLPTLPPQYLTVAENLAGKDGILAVREALDRDGVVPDYTVTDEHDLGPAIVFCV